LSTATIEWYDSAETAMERMAQAGCDALTVLDGDRPVGRVSRDDVRALLRTGNWPASVFVRDIMRRVS
jgi:predicted transcriptional regulator